MKQLKHSMGIKFLILFPVLALGIVSILSNITAISNIRNVNGNASAIADGLLPDIQELTDIQQMAQEIHQKSLSHIIATDFDTMIQVVEQIKSQEAELDQRLAAYRTFVNEDNLATYNDLLVHYEELKHAIVHLVACSADSKTAQAYAWANDQVAESSEAMQTDMKLLMEDITLRAGEARMQLDVVYRQSLIGNTITICIPACWMRFYYFIWCR